MNKKQVSYQIGRGIYNTYDVMQLAMAVDLGYEAVDSFHKSQIELGIANGAIGLCIGFSGLMGARARLMSLLESKKIRADRESYPLEHSERIVIDDTDGLEFLLSKTRASESREWGTLLKAYDDKGRAVIHDILDIPTGKERGLIGEGTVLNINFNFEKAVKDGYKGTHHYHPNVGPRWFGARNFSVGLEDRYSPKDWINLLTFNLPEGPEIIGHNRQHTYIPADSSRRELVRATPRQIMEYLA